MHFATVRVQKYFRVHKCHNSLVFSRSSLGIGRHKRERPCGDVDGGLTHIECRVEGRNGCQYAAMLDTVASVLDRGGHCVMYYIRGVAVTTSRPRLHGATTHSKGEPWHKNWNSSRIR